MISIQEIIDATGKSEESVRATGKKLSIKPTYKSFTKEHVEVEYTEAEAMAITEKIIKQRSYRFDDKDML